MAIRLLNKNILVIKLWGFTLLQLLIKFLKTNTLRNAIINKASHTCAILYDVLVQGTMVRFKIVKIITIEPVHEISNNVVCATSKVFDQPAHTRSLIRAFASRLSIIDKLYKNKKY